MLYSPVLGPYDLLHAQGEKRTQLILHGIVYHEALRKQKCGNPNEDARSRLALPLLPLGLGCPWVALAAAGPTLGGLRACGEVTPGCVETTLAKRHGNEPAGHPHRALRLRERVPGDENVDFGRERGGQSQEPGRGKARGCGLSSGRSLSLLCRWTAARWLWTSGMWKGPSGQWRRPRPTHPGL